MKATSYTRKPFGYDKVTHLTKARAEAEIADLLQSKADIEARIELLKKVKE